MRTVLKLNGEGILNFYDLQREFSPWQILSQLGVFEKFAKIHCVPLPLFYPKKDEDGDIIMRRTKYITKKFWLEEVIRRLEWPEAENAQAVLHMIIKEKMNLSDAAVSSYEAEYTGMCIDEKLRFIFEAAGLGISDEDIQKGLRLLAVCELAEMNPEDLAWQLQSTENPEEEHTKKEKPIQFFPDTESISLVAEEAAYKYWYHEQDNLQQGEIIRTVRVDARPGRNKYTSVHIELYSESTGKCVMEITMEDGEFRYCNIAGNKVIKFLPVISICGDQCIMRKELSKDILSIGAPDAEDWRLNMDNVSVFATGGSARGFLCVRRGKLNWNFLKGVQDYHTTLRFNMIFDPIAEVWMSDRGYQVLTSKGEVITDDPEVTVFKGVLSLGGTGRAPLPVLSEMGEVTDLALGTDGRSIAWRIKDEGTIKIFYESDRKQVTLRQEKDDSPTIYVKGV